MMIQEQLLPHIRERLLSDSALGGPEPVPPDALHSILFPDRKRVTAV